MDSKSSKVLVIGLDGASWNILEPLARKKDSIFKKLAEKGATGILESTIPPVTGAAWVSMATGLNPGRTGCVDFLNRRGPGCRLTLVSSLDYLGKAIWDFVSFEGLNSVIIDYPMLYPPYRIDGAIVSGLGSPTKASYPPELLDEVERVFGGYEEFIKPQDPKYEDLDKFFEELFRSFELKAKTSLYIAKKYEEWSLLFDVVSHTDWLFHRCWPLIAGEDGKYSKLSAEFLEQVGNFIDEYLKSFDLDALLLVSDHGSGSNTHRFNLARLMVSSGFIRIPVSPLDYLKYLVREEERKVSEVLSKVGVMRSVIAKLKKRRRKKAISGSVPSIYPIDLSKSRVFLLNHTTHFGAIYVNLKGREPSGIVEPSDYEPLRELIVEEMAKVGSKFGISIKSFRKEEIYWGPYVDWLPDLVLLVEEGGGAVEHDFFGKWIVKNESLSRRYLGSHRRNGLFVGFGPAFKSAKNLKLSVLDIAPMIAGLLGVKFPWEPDGSIPEGIFRGKYGDIRLDRMSKKEKLEFKVFLTSIKFKSNLKTKR